ncbi:DUF6779 domain-containing protein [Modestobacter excelsi]|uniref:DUF6779 domain-containing protein n=1 Tax=Modestobacter excelsi TaxID=2213161 RepID=UPI00110C98E4|nr:DUF6779 domain-containing protein [Modestobacter excelsi]
MGGRRDADAPGRPAGGRGTLPPVPPAPAAARVSPPAAQPLAPPAPPVPEQRRDGNRGWLVVGLLLAAGGTAAVFVTDDARYLRMALLAVCWAFVVAAFVAGNRRADQVAAAGRETELRHAYDLELEREVTARLQFEVELEGRLRREAEGAVRGELAQLRADLAGLGQLRTEVAALTEIRGELGRIRSELTEQLSGELLVERMVMRAQSVRGPVQSAPETGGRVLVDSGNAWDSPPLAAWDVDRWSESRVVPEPAGRPVPAGDGPPTTAGPVAFEQAPEPVVEPVVDAGSGYDSSRYDALLFGTSAAAPDDEPVRAAAPEPSGHARLEQILAESGVPAPTGARSRRRHRDDGDAPDDVLARVLGRR